MQTSGFNFFQNSTHPSVSLSLTLSLVIFVGLCTCLILCFFEELCVRPEVEEILGTLPLFQTKAHWCTNAMCQWHFASIWAEL